MSIVVVIIGVLVYLKRLIQGAQGSALSPQGEVVNEWET